MAIQTQRKSGGFSLLPRSRWGWLSVGFAAACLVFGALVPLAISSGLETSDFAPAVVIPMGLSGISGMAAMVAGIFGIFSRNDRSILVYMSVGLLPAALVVGFINFIVGTIMSAVR